MFGPELFVSLFLPFCNPNFLTHVWEEAGEKVKNRHTVPVAGLE